MDFLASYAIEKSKEQPKQYVSGGSIGYGYTGAKWFDGLDVDGSPPAYDNYALRQNGRRAYQDSTHAEGMAKRMADMVADVGLKFYSFPDWKTLGITEEKAQEIGDKITRFHHMYSMSKKQSRDGSFNMYQSQRLYQLGIPRDGENFIRFYYSKDSKLISPLQIGFVDPNQIVSDSITDTAMPNVDGFNGIHYNSKGEEVSYDIWVSDRKKGIKTITVPRVGEKSGRTMMLHCFAPEFPGQKRGISSIGTKAQDYKNIEDFIQSHTRKAINESNLLLSNENQQQTPSNATLGQSVPTSGLKFAQDGGECESSEYIHPELHCRRPQMPTMTPGGIMFMNLTQGDRLKLFPNTAPSAGFENYIDAYSAYVSAASGMPKSILKMEFEKSYSAARAELLLHWKKVKIERGEMASDFLNPHLESMLSEEIAKGRLSLPGWSDPRMRSAWMGGIWFGSSMPAIDPKKEAEANKVNISMNAQTLESYARDLNGSDVNTNIQKNKRTFDDLPIPYWEEDKSQQNMEE
jgi:lambda family phage portal protein